MITVPPGRSLTQGDTGEPLGPEAKLFAHLRGFSGQVKGVLPEGILKQLEQRRPGSTPALLAHLLPPFRDWVEKGVVPSDWYPETFMCAMVRAQYRVLPPRSIEEEVDFARGVFVSIAKTYHHLFCRMAGPQRLLKFSAMGWGMYHTVGKLTVLEAQERRARATLSGNPAILEPVYTEGVLASLWGAAELAGAKAASASFSVEPPDRIHVELCW